jgi:hypothetical protein
MVARFNFGWLSVAYCTEWVAIVNIGEFTAR